MTETREEKLKRLSAEYKALQQEIEEEKTADPTAMRDTLYQLLYSAIVRHGVAEDAPSVLVIQVPVVQPDPNHQINWSLADNKSSLFLRIVHKDQATTAEPPEKPKPPENGGIKIEKPVDADAEAARNEVMA